MHTTDLNTFSIPGGISVKIINEPNHYFNVVGKFPEDVKFRGKLTEPVDLIHLFTRSRKELTVELPALKKYINRGGAIIISWPNNSSGFVTDLTDDFVKSMGSANGLMPENEYEFDEEWSALKFTHSRGGN